MARTRSDERTRPPQPYRCATCGAEEDAAHWMNSKDLARSKQCQTCFTWTARLADRDDPNVARICGILFVIAPETDAQTSRGHGGRRFKIDFDDGRTVITSNLWYVGPIPYNFRVQLPDNAHWSLTP